ncbi:hypothetical protein H310_02813 [Aphanomyces invadans]|uniref:Peptidase C1A papain C-terminal domain-containing protein n=1 Tax=Aphanomyces invadans TaxID=157072 RepID=A0A024UK88_9STRA|nr:hypothetical protein H310_02813 [Aphanomyces invadans]ETW06595.1 hypothetical protein H310_02813 [Aphanomyces invadans]|eukprot:XP_008864670.1 hypothetical protein H310_02813 [Aphanomyces invadans]
MKLFVAVVAASAAATKPSVTALPIGERTQLGEELAKWRHEFGAAAAAQGVLPRAPASSSPLEFENDALQRFYNNKIAIEEARRNNPDATFSSNHPFALLTPAEFKKFVEGVSVEETRSAFRSLPSIDVNVSSVKAASVDWTTGNCVNPVRNQGQCGSCWAFSAVGVAESAHCIVTGQLLDLSEQQVTSCSTNGGSVGCRGGWPFAATTFVSTQGLCLERDYPYTSGKTIQTGTCTNSCSKQKLQIGPAGQPVSVLVEAGNHAWMNYLSGVISQCSGSHCDHAVIAVGCDGSSYKIRNSWGTSWGEAGYIRLKRGVGGIGMCNVADMVVLPQITEPSPQPTPHPGCATCNECYYSADRRCLNYNKDDCDCYSANYGFIWCGPVNVVECEARAGLECVCSSGRCVYRRQ